MPGDQSRAAPNSPLNRVELAVLNGIADGLTRKEIASLRGVSVGTIQHLVRLIEAKLGARTTEQAVAIATRSHVI